MSDKQYKSILKFEYINYTLLINLYYLFGVKEKDIKKIILKTNKSADNFVKNLKEEEYK